MLSVEQAPQETIRVLAEWCTSHNRIFSGLKVLSNRLVLLKHAAFTGAPTKGALFFTQPGGCVVYHNWDSTPRRIKKLATCVKSFVCPP